MASRAHRRENVQKAYDVQVKAGLEGAARYTSIGVGLAILAHYTWPFFRRQTLAFKGFLVTGFTVFGLCTYAESALQQLETEQRRTESIIRKEARIDLQRRGIVPTETAIAQWRAQRAQETADAADQSDSPSK
ncbi:hypothetical protein NM688_g4468 [Phlebia brevispora]|uniref:Uncharacterized protein n=1 Tax=Phlebia brevispora TaxID=194682 RepID=A0ACC1T370_9APHY|nr:hypothetical protein NM688_g4468 [Phlebia brevispora]